MKTKKNKLIFDKKSITELNNRDSKKIIGGTISIGPTKNCTFCINSSNGPGGTILEDLFQA